VNFMTLGFVLFMAVLLIVMRFCKNIRAQHIILLIASYVFYALGDWRFLGMLFAISLLMWALGRGISKYSGTGKAKALLAAGVAVDLLTLGIFKYLDFFAENFSRIFGMSHVTLKIILPIGISFYLFQAISYLADVYHKRVEAQASPLKILLYIGFFPQIVSGPIVKSKDFLPQLSKAHAITRKNLSWGVQKFAVGLFKKAVIADRLAVAVDAVFSAPAAYDSVSITLAVISYTLELYCDFSGYSDMAIGVAKMLGFDLGINFNLPFLAKNPSDFWRRWHISLSSWFRDYVYIPLGGNRRGRLRTYFNLFVTMLLSGIWHGASWTFIIWGICWAVASTLHKIFSDIRKHLKIQSKGALSKLSGAVSILITFAVTVPFFVPFRAGNLSTTGVIFSRMFTSPNGIHYISVYAVIFMVLLFAVNLIAAIFNKKDDLFRPLDLSKWRWKLVFCLFVVFTFCFAYIGNTAFIYSQF